MVSFHAPTQETGAILFYITCVLCILLIAPTLIYCTFWFNQYKNTIVVRKRYPHIIMVIVVLLILNIALRIPLTLLVITPTTLPILNSLHHSNAFLFIESFLNIYITHAAVTLIALRFWMIFYKINYAYSSSTSAWKTVINPLISTNNWFLQPSNKSKYGNAKSMFCRYFLPFYIIYGTFDFFLLINNRWSLFFELNLSFYQLISGFYYLIVMTFCVYLYKQTPNWEDHCFIRAEMRLGSLTWFICLVFYVIDGGTFLIVEIIANDAQTHEYIQHIIAIYIGLIFFTAYSLVLTWYPTNKVSVKPSDLSRASSPDQIAMVQNEQRVKNRNEAQTIAINTTRAIRNRAKSEPQISSLPVKQHRANNHSKDDSILAHNQENGMQPINDDDLGVILSDVLSDAALFDRFMMYLSRSFSTESLLSFIEFYHFKQFIILQFKDELLSDENKLFIQRLKLKMHSRRHKHSSRKLRNRNLQTHATFVASNLWNVMLPDAVPKSYLVFGDFMVQHLINGKSIKQSMGILEKSASKFGIKLHEAEKQKKLQQQPNSPSDGDVDSKTNSTQTQMTSPVSDPSDVSKSDGLDIHNRSTKRQQMRSSVKRAKLSNLRKESTVHSTTDASYNYNVAGSYNSVRLQIPDAHMDPIQMSMESVTEKDIYDDIKVGTPSIVSQSTRNADINSMDRMDIDMEESRTTTYHDPKHLTGGVSVEVDEHFHKNREISVTPQPSQTSVVTSITNAPGPYSMMYTNTMSKMTKKHRENTMKERRTVSITPYGSTRQRYGSTGGAISQLSVSMDEKEVLQEHNELTMTKESRSGVSGGDGTPNTPITPSNGMMKGIGFGDMPMDMDEAVRKIGIIAHKLYMKYVNIGSEFEINIPHRVRKKLMKLKMDNADQWMTEKTKWKINELYHLFDECMEEMFALMRSSIAVFLESHDYQQNCR